MTFYEQELKKLFGGSNVIRDAKYSGKTLLGRIDDELRVKLQFVYTGTRDHYNALRLKIINRTDGEVDAETFKFSDILGGNPAYQNNPFAGKSTFGRTTGTPIGTATILLPQPIRRSPIP